MDAKSSETTAANDETPIDPNTSDVDMDQQEGQSAAPPEGSQSPSSEVGSKVDETHPDQSQANISNTSESAGKSSGSISETENAASITSSTNTAPATPITEPTSTTSTSSSVVVKINTPVSEKPVEPPRIIDEEDAKWHTVGIFPGLSTNVTNYVDNSVWTSAGDTTFNADNLPDLAKFKRINLEPGTAYRFRLRAINACGASEWSEISSFKTCLPGYPGAPSAIKISKSSEGAHLTWEPPPSCLNSNEIVEYSVYLAVKPAKEKDGKTGAAQRIPAQLAFVRVYVGAVNQCTVAHTSLTAAHVDCSNKPAIIFRIAARNEKGYGPATQVRWLQDPVQQLNQASMNVRIKPELGGGSSPIKRFKAGTGGRGMPGSDN